jgi:hypothetical protein
MDLALFNPALAWGMLAAGIPVLIHLFYRRRPRPTPFPAIDFVLKARRETQRRLRLRKILLFVARTCLIAALAMALTRPSAQKPTATAAAPQGPAATAIVLDASGSMRYRLGGTPLFDRAKADAIGVLDSLRSDEPATALVCGSGMNPSAAAPTFDRRQVRKVLEAAQPTWGHADLTACIGAAVRALADSAAGVALGKRLVVATDLTAAAWRLDTPPPSVATPSGAVRPEVTVLDAARGAPLPNTAITGVEAEPDPAVGPRGYRLEASLTHQGPNARAELPVQLRVGSGKETISAVRGFAEVAAGGSAKKVLTYNFPSGGPTAAAITLAEDALPIDDVRVVTLAVPRDVKALVVNGAPSPVKYRDEAFFVEAALSSPASPVRPTVIDGEALAEAKLTDFDVIFLLNVRSAAGRAADLRAFAERGGGIFLALGDQVDPDQYDNELKGLLPQPLHLVKTAAERGTPGSAQRAARFERIDWEHPALAIFEGPAREGFEGVRTYRYALLKPGDGSRAIAGYDDGAPALVEARRGKGRVILYTSSADREWSDWPIRTSFLPAIQRFAAYLTGGLEHRRDAPSALHAERPVVGEEGQKVIAVVAPDGSERKLESAPGYSPTVTPEQPGLWQVKVEDGQGVRLDPRLAFAVHPDDIESNTARLDPKEITAYFGGADHVKVAGANPHNPGHTGVPLWSILLALGLLAFMAEGLLIS